MVPPVCCFRRRSFGFACAVFLFAAGALEAQEAEGERVSEIPSRFFQTQDANGYFWQIAENGAITSGETQYLQSGLNWLVEGSAFAPSMALVRPPDLYPETAGVTLEEQRETLNLKRDLWIDRERGGVRTLDTIRNTGREAAELEVVLRTTYPFAWQSLHGVDGELLSKDPVLALDDRDFGLVVHCSAAEGRHDTFLVVGQGEGSLRPRLTASNNRRELSLTYQLVIPAGGSQSLLHVISQQSLPDMEEVGAVFSAWFSRNELVRPAVSSVERSVVANFASTAFPDESTEAGGLETLLSLNQLLDPLGLNRRKEDVHWVSASNRVSGTIAEKEPLKIQASHVGELTIPFSSIAAIQGGAGIGRKPVFYLRNGEVRVGPVNEGSLTMTASGEAEARPLDLDSVNLLMMKQKPDDGVRMQDGAYFVQLMDRSVFTIKGDSALLPLVTPWGFRERAVSSLSGMSHVSRPYPTYRFVTADGSIFPGFLSDTSVELPLLGGGMLEVPTYLLDLLWRAGSSELEVMEAGDEWLSFDEVPTGVQGGFLTRGNAFLQGSLAESTIRLLDGGTSLEIESSSIRSIERDFDRDSTTQAGMVVELTNGEILRGELSRPFLSIVWEGTPLDIPVESLLAFQSPSTAPRE